LRTDWRPTGFTSPSIADVVAFLVRELARWITGQLIVANGGSAA
jgi:hypothetical protein